MLRLRSVFVIGGWLAFLGVLAVAPALAAETDVLSLVSWQYRLNGKEVPREPSLLPYVPYMRSRNAAVAEVAALSVVCEVTCDQASLATVGFQRKALQILPVNPDSPETPAIERKVAARQQEFLGPLRAPMEAAAARGLLDAYSREDMVRMSNGAGPRSKTYFSQMVAVQSDKYRAQLSFRNMQAVLWDRCEALACAQAGAKGLADSGARVTLEGEKKRNLLYFNLVLRNQSGRDLRNVTLSVFSPAPTRQPHDPPAAVAGLAAAMNSTNGEDDGATIIGNARSFQASRSDYEKIQALPVRMFFHVPVLAAGQELKARFQGAAFGKTPPTFSLWSDEGRWEKATIGGLDELRAQAEQHRKEFEAKVEASRQRNGGGVLFGGRPAPAADATALANRTPANNPRRMLQQAFAASVGGPIQAARQYQAIVDQFPNSPEAKKAKTWLDAYPQLLLDRAASLRANARTQTQAIRFYEEVLKIRPNGDEAEKARAGLDTIGETMLARGNQFVDRGDTRQAQRVYQQIVRTLPKTNAAETARGRLKGLTPRKSP